LSSFQSTVSSLPNHNVSSRAWEHKQSLQWGKYSDYRYCLYLEIGALNQNKQPCAYAIANSWPLTKFEVSSSSSFGDIDAAMVDDLE